VGNTKGVLQTHDIDRHNMLSAPNINAIIKYRRTESAEHAACMGKAANK
jgi:hypothetical protein